MTTSIARFIGLGLLALLSWAMSGCHDCERTSSCESPPDACTDCPAPVFASWIDATVGAGDRRIAFATDGDLVVAGDFEGFLSFDDQPQLSASEASDTFVAKIASTGAPTVRWTQLLGGSETQTDPRLAVEQDGTIAVTGRFTGTLEIGMTTLEGGGINDAYLAGFEPGGALERIVFLTTQPGTGELPVGTKHPEAVAFEGARVLVAGGYSGHFGACNPCMSADGDAAFLQIRSEIPLLSEESTVPFDGPGAQSFLGILVRPGGGRMVSGTFEQEIDLDGEILTATGAGFVARLDDTSASWATPLGAGTGTQTPLALALSGDALLVTGGTFRGEITLAEPVAATGEEDLFVAAYEADTGAFAWGLTAGAATGFERVTAMAGAPDGSIVVAADFGGSLTLGDKTFEAAPHGECAAGGSVLFALEPDGRIRWTRALDNRGDVSVSSLAVDAAGRIAIAGSFCGEITFGGATRTSASEATAFVAVFE
jgi:hypothetical protein